jgi:hypothetical protein
MADLTTVYDEMMDLATLKIMIPYKIELATRTTDDFRGLFRLYLWMKGSYLPHVWSAISPGRRLVGCVSHVILFTLILMPQRQHV